MIKIYTDKTFITQDYRRIIFPLLFELCYVINENLLKKYVLVETAQEADVMVVPIDIAWFFKNNKEKWLNDFIDKGNRLNKKVWVYSAGDFGITLNKDVYTFRLGGFHSKLDAKTFIFPSFIMDPYLGLKKEFVPLNKSLYPTIGFVGHADGSFFKWCKEFFNFGVLNFKRITKKYFSDYQPFYPSSRKRYQFLSLLQENLEIKTNFIFRTKYRAGANNNENLRELTTKEFFENINTNAYTFCLRGAGNFSVRLYETLAMGRIPVLIDTDIRLPNENVISWKNHCVIVSENNFMEKLIDFHKNITDKEFKEMQINNRKLWVNQLNREGYFNEIYTAFKDLI
jgi:hypothetical protein